MPVEARITGWKEVAKAARKSGDETLPKLMKDGMLAAATLVAGAAQSGAPVLTGALRSSLKVTSSVTAGRVKFGSAKVRWAGPINWGWDEHNIKANPFLTGAFASNETAGLAILEAVAADVAKKFGD